MDRTLFATGSATSPAGGVRAVLEASAAAVIQGDVACLAVVMGTEGSTYVRVGAMALFGSSSGQVGWLSGGCLEPAIERSAISAARQQRIEWLDIDTRDDEALFSGYAVGCRGRLRIALIPLQAMPGWNELVVAWRAGVDELRIEVDVDGGVSGGLAGGERQRWSMPVAALPEPWANEEARSWRVSIAAPPKALLLGAGPETSVLLPLLRDLGWTTTLVDHRTRWAPLMCLADVALELAPQAALLSLQSSQFDAALVMYHNFELDREALAALASSDIGFVGLLGPKRRRVDLFAVLPADARVALLPRLHSPVGLDLGGRGPATIALSIAAQLHTIRPSA
jgi:xanthine dehydrogenase accessory factor